MSNVNRWITKLAAFMSLGSPVVTDSRRRPRLRADFPVWLSSEDGLQEVRCLDLNRTGMAVQTACMVPAGTLVFLRIGTAALAGFAHVRHCRAVENGYVLGLEFRGDLVRERPIESDWSYDQVVPQAAWDEVEA